jgi:hypothetical protein
VRRKLWSALALCAGALLLFFELRQAHGVTADNVFWLLVGALIVVLALIDLVQKRPNPGEKRPSDID